MKGRHYNPTPPREKSMPREPDVAEHIPCDECGKEIPHSVAVRAEGDDYVRHFCGLDCYRKWSRRVEQQQAWST